MTHHHPIDIDEACGRERRWFVAALTDQLVSITVRVVEDDDIPPLRLELDASEAHDLGTMLRRMARKANTAVAAQ